MMAKAETSTHEHVPIVRWGTDHWNVLALIERALVRRSWSPEFHEFRCSPERHPNFFRSGMPVTPRGTLLADGGIIALHDDWDCIGDLEREGLLDWGAVKGKPRLALTDRGWSVAGLVRRYMADVDRGIGGFRAWVCDICSRTTYGAYAPCSCRGGKGAS